MSTNLDPDGLGSNFHCGTRPEIRIRSAALTSDKVVRSSNGLTPSALPHTVPMDKVPQPNTGAWDSACLPPIVTFSSLTAHGMIQISQPHPPPGNRIHLTLLLLQRLHRFTVHSVLGPPCGPAGNAEVSFLGCETM